MYEINTRVLLNELSQASGSQVTLGTIPDKVLDEWAALGFDAIWMMGVWTTGDMGLDIARTHAGLLEDYRRVLHDFSDADVVGSPYAVKAYSVPKSLGGKEGLQVLRERLAERGLGLILDFVCNHTARDHAWVKKHPEYYVQGTLADAEHRPDAYFKAETVDGEKAIAFGKDPYFPGWTDTAQLNYLHSGARAALIKELKNIASLCDGIRCDMAMLVLSDVFIGTWGDSALPPEEELAHGEFWPDAIAEVREANPEFVFIAEAYWDLEWKLQQLGFDWTYDKKLYDRLLKEGSGSVYDHLHAELEYQKRSVRFIENHDEPRAAQSLASDPWHFAAVTIIAAIPGMVLLHEGQLDGRRVKLPVQLGRRPSEPVSELTRSFYERLLKTIAQPVFRQGEWKLLNAKPAWHDNHTWANFQAYWWKTPKAARLVVVNYAPLNGQCYVELTEDILSGHQVEFRDLLGSAVYTRDVQQLQHKGMYFDLPPYGVHVFEVKS